MKTALLCSIVLLAVTSASIEVSAVKCKKKCKGNTICVPSESDPKKGVCAQKCAEGTLNPCPAGTWCKPLDNNSTIMGGPGYCSNQCFAGAEDPCMGGYYCNVANSSMIGSPGKCSDVCYAGAENPCPDGYYCKSGNTMPGSKGSCSNTCFAGAEDPCPPLWYCKANNATMPGSPGVCTEKVFKDCTVGGKNQCPKGEVCTPNKPGQKQGVCGSQCKTNANPTTCPAGESCKALSNKGTNGGCRP